MVVTFVVIVVVIARPNAVDNSSRRTRGELREVNLFALLVDDFCLGQGNRQRLRPRDLTRHRGNLPVGRNDLDELVDVHAVLLGGLHHVVEQFVLSDLNVFLLGNRVEQNLGAERLFRRFHDLGAVSVVGLASLLLKVPLNLACRRDERSAATLAFIDLVRRLK